MDSVEREDVYRKAISKWGGIAQILICVEECSELQKALLHDMRVSKNSTDEEILDELVDVSIMVEQMRNLYQISDGRFLKKKNLKLLRLKELLEGDGV